MNCCDERLVSVVTRVEHHRARGGSRSGGGVGRGFPMPFVVVKVFSGFVAFVHLKKDNSALVPRKLPPCDAGSKEGFLAAAPWEGKGGMATGPQGKRKATKPHKAPAG